LKALQVYLSILLPHPQNYIKIFSIMKKKTSIPLCLKIAAVTFLTMAHLLLISPASFARQTTSYDKPKDKKIYIIPHTHTDLSWVGTPGYCIEKNIDSINGVLKIIKDNPDYRYTIETVAVLKEFLKKYPGKKDIIQTLLNKKVIDCGGFYVGCCEGLAGPEGLIRNLYFGKKWLAETLGYKTDFVWNVDLPGHTSQLPQILCKSGIKYLVTQRAFQGPWLSQWISPDGSKVVQCELPGGYDNHLSYKNPSAFFNKFKPMLEKYSLPDFLAGAVGGDCGMPDSKIINTIKKWDRDNKNGLIDIELLNSSEFFEKIEGVKLPSFSGENPSAWDFIDLYVPRYGLLAKPLENKLLTGEKIATLAKLMAPGYHYPSEDIRMAWKNWLLNREHNWGGKDGQVSDAIKMKRLREANRIMDRAINDAANAVSENIGFKQSGFPIVIFNPLSWPRKDTVTLKIPKIFLQKLNKGGGITLLDADKNTVVFQSSNDGTEIIFIAQVPPIGYATYYLYPGLNTRAEKPRLNLEKIVIENKFFRVSIDSNSGDITSIVDKSRGRRLINAGKPAFSELVAEEYVSKHMASQPHLTGKEWKSRSYPSSTETVQDGPVISTIRTKTRFIEDKDFIREISIYKDLKRIDFKTTIINWENKVKKNKLSPGQAFPLNIGSKAKLFYEVPYAFINYPAGIHPCAGWKTPDQASRIHNYLFVKNWLDLSDDAYGVTFLTRWNYFEIKNNSENSSDSYIIQSAFFKTDQNFGGNPYFFDTSGTHTYELSLRPHKGPLDPARATRAGWEYNCPLIAKINIKNKKDAALPESFSFCKVEPANIIISALKLSEDGKGVILRCYDAGGKDSLGKINISIQVKDSFLTDALEEQGSSLSPKNPVSFRLNKYEIKTIEIIPQ